MVKVVQLKSKCNLTRLIIPNICTSDSNSEETKQDGLSVASVNTENNVKAVSNSGCSGYTILNDKVLNYEITIQPGNQGGKFNRVKYIFLL